MIPDEFKKLKGQVDKLLKKAEDEALEGGANIISPEFREALRKLKRGLLAQRGISLEEYELMESEREVDEIDVDDEDLVKFAKKVRRSRKETKKETQETIGQLQKEFLTQTQRLTQEQEKDKKELINHLKELSKKIKKGESSLRQEREETKDNLLKAIEKAKEHKWEEHPEFVRDLNEFERQFQGLLKGIKETEKKREQSDKERKQIEDGILTFLEKYYE